MGSHTAVAVVVVWFRSLSEVRRGCSGGVAWYGDHINSCCYTYIFYASNLVEASIHSVW
jgi:hypothetical protein